MSPPRPHNSRARARAHAGAGARAGVTLIEMLTSLAIVSIVMVAMSSAVLLASRATPGRASVGAHVRRGSEFLTALASELAYATVVTEMTPTSVAFEIADRTGDDRNESVRYAWSGKAGDPILRTLNDGEPAPVLEDAHEFALAYDRLRLRNPTTYAEGPERLLFSYTGETSLGLFAVTPDRWLAQQITPTFAPEVEFWRVTRVRARLQQSGAASGETRVQVRGASFTGLPTPTVYGKVAVAESMLPAPGATADAVIWSEWTFPQCAGIPTAANGACVVFQWAADSQSCDVVYCTLLGAGGLATTADGGATWLPGASQSIPLLVWGRGSSKAPESYAHVLAAVRVAARTGPLEGGRLATDVAIVNQPEVPEP